MISGVTIVPMPPAMLRVVIENPRPRMVRLLHAYRTPSQASRSRLPEEAVSVAGSGTPTTITAATAYARPSTMSAHAPPRKLTASAATGGPMIVATT